MSTKFPYRYAYSVTINGPAEKIFSLLDDQKNLSSHMEESSWMMAGSSMSIELDSEQGREVGSEIVLRGSMMGVPLYIREYVTERRPPTRKAWETSGPQKLVILDQYRMGFEIAGSNPSTLTVFIDYSLPGSGLKRVLGKMLGKIYAKWCTEQMANDAAKHFGN